MDLVYIVFAVLLLAFDVWSLYSIPAVVVGVRSLLRGGRRGRKSLLTGWEDELSFPFVSVVVPVKNEEKVVGRLLKALLKLDYPSSRLEVVVVNDGSCDRTGVICRGFALGFGGRLRVFDRAESSTKAAALNFGVCQARGDIIATFDADSVPERDVVRRAVGYFSDVGVAGVQGRVCSVNSGENMLTRFLSLEGAVQYEGYIRGKDCLGLFVGLAGTCQFIRRGVLDAVGGWNERSLSEDVELSLRLVERGYVVRYAGDVRTWEESPNSVSGLVRQRARWYRGNIGMMFRFGRLMRRFSLRRFDAEVSLLGTLLIALCVVNYFMAVWTWFLPPDLVFTWIMRLSSFFTLAVLALAGVALVFVSRPLRLRSVLWLPFIYAYWGFQSFIAFYAVLQILLRRPPNWSKTERSGVVSDESVKSVLTA